MPFLLLMPSYNQAHFICSAVDSCLAQRDPDWELWILDNSTDDTPERMKAYADPRIHFIHEPRRMDPGSCLNELLAKANGEAFSYVHTDNELGPDYVGRFRQALSGRRLALAYCDHWVMDGQGERIGLERRQSYELGNLLGGHGLGVPFSATTDVAAAVGGFSSEDLADDVRFCDLAWGLGDWIHLREPLMTYRIHAQSRTEGEGAGGVLRAILRAHARALPLLTERGLDPLRSMSARLRELIVQLDTAAIDTWLRKCGPWPAWAGETPGLDPLWKAGLVRLPNFGASKGGPARWLGLLRPKALLDLHGLQVEIQRLHPLFRSVLLGWAFLMADAPAAEFSLCLGSPDFATLWAGRILERELGWTVQLDARRKDWPSWCKWGTGDPTASAGWLDLSGAGDAPLGPRCFAPSLSPLEAGA